MLLYNDVTKGYFPYEYFKEATSMDIAAWIKDNWSNIVIFFDKIFAIVEAILAK